MGTRNAALIYVALTLLLTWPLCVSPATTSLSTGPDGNLFIWTLAWDAHAFINQPLSIFDANIYHPLRHTLAYSENMIGSALVSAPVQWITGNPVLGLNLVALLSCVLCGLGAFVLARRVGLGPAGAVLAGMIFAFSPARFFRIGQLHLAVVQWIPFALASLHTYLDAGRRRDLRLAAAFFTLQALSSGHGAVFLVLAIAGLVIFRALCGEDLAAVRRVRDLGITGALLLLPSVLVFLPYRTVQQEMGLRRSLENWAVTPGSFFASPTHLQAFVLSFLPEAHILDSASAFLFPGYLPLLLAAAALVGKPRFGIARESRTAGSHDGSYPPAFRPFDDLRVAPSNVEGRHAQGVLSLPKGAGESPHDSVAQRRTGWNVVDRTLDREDRLLRIAAVVLEIAAVALLAIAVTLTIVGATKIRVGSTVILSSRSPWRPWLLFVAVAALRAALAARVPFDVGARLRRALEAVRRWRAARRQDPVTFYGLLTVISLWLSIGPPLGLWPLVYWWPGMSFIRVPSRFIIVTVLGLAVLAGAGFERLSARLAPRRRFVLASVAAALLVMEFAAIPLKTASYRLNPPMADRWLASRPAPFAVAEVPLPDPMNAGAFERRQTLYMLHSMAHWQKTVHGYSGFRAPLHEELYLQLRNFPDEASLRNLSRLGVGYIVVHTELYPPGEWPQVESRIGRFDASLRLEHVAGEGRIYSLRSLAQQ